MKRILILILLVGTGTAVEAQLGIQAGLNFSNYKYWSNDIHSERSTITGFNAGLLYRQSIGKYLAIKPSLIYSRKGAKKDTGVPDSTEYYYNKLNYTQLSVPVLFCKGIGKDLSISVGLGPYLGYLLSANSRQRFKNGEDSSISYSIGSNTNNDFKRMDLGLRFMGGFRYARAYCYLSYDIGLSDVSPNDLVKIKNRCMAVNIVLFFR